MRWFIVASFLTFAFVVGPAPAREARAEEKSAEQLIKEINAVEMPKLDPSIRGNQEAMIKFRTAYVDAMVKKAGLIGDLYKKNPKHPSLSRLLPERWEALAMAGKIDEAKKEIDEVSANSENASLKTDATFIKAILAVRADDTDAALKAVESFLKLAPKDERGPLLLFQTASQAEDPKKQVELFKRITHDFPNSEFAKNAEGNLKRLESIGKPFELEFTDAIKGTEVSMKSLKGKVVVIDFWATWCGPCVGEMPKMKALYEEYKDKGVEFVGVSLDRPKEEGGLDSLKSFVAKNEIKWPQYYEGKTSASDFATAWGINAIPSLFVVDADGNLYSVEARGKLEKMIPELLKKAKGKTGGEG